VTAVSPFGAYSETLQSIPLFGKIFSGDRKGIATAMFSMIGPLAEPHVVYMPHASLKAGLKGLAQLAFDVLENMIVAPVRALNGVLNGALNHSTSSFSESPTVDPEDLSETEEESQPVMQ